VEHGDSEVSYVTAGVVCYGHTRAERSIHTH
jgi:hypothetical protein